MSAPKTRPPVLQRRALKAKARRARFDEQRALGSGGIGNRYVLVNPEKLAPARTFFGTPDFVERGHYVARAFVCKTCGAEQVWTETQQKWWYEVAKGDVWSLAIRCRPCRRQEQARRTAARQVHLGGLAKKRKSGKSAG
jgi:hypothetical protein